MAITKDEMAVVGALAHAWVLWLKLPREHNDDSDEFRRIIHAAQEKVLCREGRRQMNEPIETLEFNADESYIDFFDL